MPAQSFHNQQTRLTQTQIGFGIVARQAASGEVQWFRRKAWNRLNLELVFHLRASGLIYSSGGSAHFMGRDNTLQILLFQCGPEKEKRLRTAVRVWLEPLTQPLSSELFSKAWKAFLQQILKSNLHPMQATSFFSERFQAGLEPESPRQVVQRLESLRPEQVLESFNLLPIVDVVHDSAVQPKPDEARDSGGWW